VLLGTDGDADRFGLVDPEGRYFGANQAIPLLADYLIRYKNFKGDLVRTVSTSHLIDRVAADHGFKLIETPVGFKYVGDELRKGAIIGGEESGGVSIKGHVPEKDGILASVLMLELAATTGEDFHTLLTEMMNRLGSVSFVRVDQEMPEERKTKLFKRLATYDDDEFAGQKIARRNDIDGVKFEFENGSWVLMRPSGTEPLVRIYVECAPDNLDRFKKQVLDAAEKLGS
jgi:phosphomannomutase